MRLINLVGKTHMHIIGCFVHVQTSFLSAIGTSRSKAVGVEFNTQGLELPGVVDGSSLGDSGWSCARVVGKSLFFG